MWTNVFKIGGLHHVSWFQLLPRESDLNPLPDRSVKLEQNDVDTFIVLQSHLQLQNENFLSTWTNSFVGPWDPSQGSHNPDEKIKLWLFLPGHHSSVVEAAQAAVSGLKVVANGLWSAPGDSEAVSTALSQALRNLIERSMMERSYMRFGDVFSRCHTYSQSGELSRRDQPTIEFVFAATVEAVFVHVIISSKHICPVTSEDIEKMSNHSNDPSFEMIPAIVSPHGMHGWLSGCCPSDLVKQVYFSSGKLRASNGVIGLPYHVSNDSGGQLGGQSCYVEVALGCPSTESEVPKKSHCAGSFQKHQSSETRAVRTGDQNGFTHQLTLSERTFIYPTEAVLIPAVQMSSARCSLKRFWMQNWIGPSLSASSFFMRCSNFTSVDKTNAMGRSCLEVNGTDTHQSHNSSRNSNSSSISSTSCSSSDGDDKITTGGDIEADADSLTCRQSGLSSYDHLDNDCQKLGSKRPRTGMTESLSQVTNAPARSGFSTVEVNDLAIKGVGKMDNGFFWDLDDDDRGVGMDIQALLSAFGDFGDFFENDSLPFGEPPGTAESQAKMYSGPECGDVGSSPCTGAMDVSDQVFLPVGFTSCESFSPPLPAVAEESHSKNQEAATNVLSAEPGNCTIAPSTGEFDHLIKAEALMTFAPEYGAVETPTSELSSSVFRFPYLPKSQRSESLGSCANNYVYGATPPSSPCLDGSEDKSIILQNSKNCHGGQDSSVIPQIKKYYTYMKHDKEQNRKLYPSNHRFASSELTPASFSGLNSGSTVKSAYRKTAEGGYGIEQFFHSTKTVLATELECVLFQAFMCRIRHTVPSSNSSTLIGLTRLPRHTLSNQLHVEPSSLADNATSKFEMKKKESVPLRIASDIDGGVLDGPFNAAVGVWRTVGGLKSMENTHLPGVEIRSTLNQNLFNEEVKLSYGQRQPLQELLDGLAFLVQQATSFVDLSLDADYGDGIFGWLALQEQKWRGFSCGPSMIHAGCGGALASCHSLDVSGMELADPLSANVHASSVFSLLQSDIRIALKAAFKSLEGCSLEGPMSVADWCRGCVQSGDAYHSGDGFSAESTIAESRDTSRTLSSVEEPLSPSQHSGGGSSCLKACSSLDGVRSDESCNWQRLGTHVRPTLLAIPLPAILVGYQDDWLKTSANSIQLWEKAPFEPYALHKAIHYYVICPDIDPLTSAAVDFFEQLGTVYETCKLGSHLPASVGSHMEMSSTKPSSSGFIFLDSPQSMKIESSNASLVGSISDYFLSLSNGWNLTSFLQTLSSVLKALKLGSWLARNPKEGFCGSCMVIYVVCPFPEPAAVLQTVIESSVAVGSTILSSDREMRSAFYGQIAKSLNCSVAVDEASMSNVFTLSGFSIPKLVLQIVTVDAIFRVTSPPINELIVLKELAFTVYNKARRISRGYTSDAIQSSSLTGKSHSDLMQMPSPGLGLWKDSVGSRRESELDPSARSGPWDNSWQTPRTGGLDCNPNRTGDFLFQDESRYMFEPLFILAEPGSIEHGISPTAFANLGSESSKLAPDESSGFMQSPSSSGSVDTGPSSQLDGLEYDGFGYGHQKTPPSLHCCYGWTEDWRWLVCIWTDSRGEMLDCHVFPFGGISGRQDTKGMQCLFVQVLQQGCLILQSCASESGMAKPRDFVIARIGCFYELECQEWQKAIYAVGGSEIKKWPLQLRRSVPDVMSLSSNGQQELGLIQERATLPSSPSSLYCSQPKASGFIKGALGHSVGRQRLVGGQTSTDTSRGLLQWVQSISLVTVSIDHSMQFLLHADASSCGTQAGSLMGPLGYQEGFTPVKSLGTTSASYILIPSPGMRFIPQAPLQLPTCLTAQSPPLAHLLHSKGSAIPFSTGFVVSKSVPGMRKDSSSSVREEWPSILSVSLVDHYGCRIAAPEKLARGVGKPPDVKAEMHLILESVAAQLHALSWMTVSPAYVDRRTVLPFHCDMVLRLVRLLHFAERELLSAAGGKP